MNNRELSRTAFWSPLIMLSAGHLLSDFYNNFLPPLLPVLTTNLGLSLTASGLLVMVYSFTSSILQPLCGYYMDKINSAPLILLTLPLSALFIIFSAMVPNLTLLFIFVAIAGLASSIFHPLGSIMTGRLSSPANRGLALAIFIGGGNFGFALSPLIVVFCLVKFGLNSLIYLAIPAIVLTLAYWAGGFHRFNTVATGRKAQQTAALTWHNTPNVLMLNMVMAFRSWSQVAIPTFLPLLLASRGKPPELAAGLLTVFLMGGAAGGFIGGYLGDKLGHKKSILLSLATCVPALWFFLAGSQTSPTAWIMLGLAGAALQSTVPSSIVWAQKMLPANAAMASGMMLGLSFGLGGVGTALTGAMADYTGLNLALLLTLIPLIFATLLTYFIPEPKPEHSLAGLSQSISS